MIASAVLTRETLSSPPPIWSVSSGNAGQVLKESWRSAEKQFSAGQMWLETIVSFCLNLIFMNDEI